MLARTAPRRSVRSAPGPATSATAEISATPCLLRTNFQPRSDPRSFPSLSCVSYLVDEGNNRCHAISTKAECIWRFDTFHGDRISSGAHVLPSRVCTPQQVVNEYYQHGERRAGRVQDLFGDIAPRYDLLNDLQSFGLHRAWKRKVVELAAVRPGARALDVCCGTGDIALAMRERGAEVVGIDFSVPMLRVGVARNHNGVSWMQGDALRL